MKTHALLAAAALLAASPQLWAHPDRPRPSRASHSHAAAGGSYWDIRFGVGGEPMLTDSEYDFAGGSDVDAEEEWEEGGAGSFEINAAHRFAARGPGSGYMTFGGFARGFDGENEFNNNDEVGLGVFGVQVGGGFSYRPNARYSVEIGPRLGFGVASATEEFNGDELESDSGGYARLDFGVTNLFNFGTLQLGVTVGIAGWAATVPYDDQLVNGTFYPEADVTYSGSGGYLNFSMGFR